MLEKLLEKLLVTALGTHLSAVHLLFSCSCYGSFTSGLNSFRFHQPSAGHNSTQQELDRIVAEAVRGLKTVSLTGCRYLLGHLVLVDVAGG